MNASSSTGDGAPSRRTVAFFDVDGTLLTVQSGFLYIGYLQRNGLMPFADRVRLYWAFVTYKFGFLNIKGLVNVSSRWLKGRVESEVLAHCRDWYETEVCHYYRDDVVRRVEAHKAAGHLVVLLTGGTRYLNDCIVEALSLHGLIASTLRVVDGRFTGEPDLPLCYGKGKVHYAERFARDHGVDLADCYYYADSFADVAMFERVGFPCVVAPDPRLRREARARGWPQLGEDDFQHPAR